MTVSKKIWQKFVGTQQCCVLLVISHQSLDLNGRHSLSYLEIIGVASALCLLDISNKETRTAIASILSHNFPLTFMSQLREHIEKNPSETTRLLGLGYD